MSQLRPEHMMTLRYGKYGSYAISKSSLMRMTIRNYLKYEHCKNFENNVFVSK